MTAPGAKRRGRPRHARQFDPLIAQYLNGEIGPSSPAFLDILDAGLSSDLEISIFANLETAEWLAAAFGEVESWLIYDVAEFSGGLLEHRTDIRAKSFRARRFLGLLARSFEAATGERATTCSSNCKGRFFRFAWIVLKTSHCPILWPGDPPALRSAIERALRERSCDSQRNYEGLARFNAKFGKNPQDF